MSATPSKTENPTLDGKSKQILSLLIIKKFRTFTMTKAIIQRLFTSV